MKRRLLILAITFLVAPFALSWAQSVQEFVVNDFSGGLVNSVTNNLMQKNQAIVLSNYDVDQYGALKRRQGFGVAYSGSMAQYPGVGMFSYYGGDGNKMLLALRRDSSRYLLPLVVGMNMASLFKCTDGGDCATYIGNGFYFSGKRLTYPFNVTTATVNDNIVIAETGSELRVYDGHNIFNARPFIKGQPRAEPLDGIGTITGTVRYMYVYSNTHCPGPSTPSFPLYVNAGKVWVHGIIDAAGNDTVRIYRQDNLKGYWYKIDSLVNDSTFIDSMSMATALTKSYFNSFVGLPSTSYDRNDDSASPGGLVVTIDSSKAWDSTEAAHGLAVQQGHGCDTCTIVASYAKHTSYFYYAWAVVFQDSAGRYSYMTPPTVKRIAEINDWYRPKFDTLCYKAIITSIPAVPSIDTAAIRKKYLVRACLDYTKRFLNDPQRPCDTFGRSWNYNEQMRGQFYIIADIPLATTTYRDSITPVGTLKEYCSVADTSYLDSLKGRCVGGSITPRIVEYEYTRTLHVPLNPIEEIIAGYCNDDSTIMFRPSTMALHLNRLYAAGNPQARNAIYFSNFGKPTCWPNDRYINLPSQGGDWINGLMSMGDWLAIFRQNSIVGLSGLSFYQYNATSVSEKIGLTAPQSLASGLGVAYFAHTTGVYRLPGDNWQMPISYPIQHSLDSAGDRLRSAWGAVVGKEYWISIPVSPDSVNTKTYIYSSIPKPHWKSYSRGFVGGAAYDNAGSSAEYNSKRWIFMEPDSLFFWNYTADTLDIATRIASVYQSPYFFADPARERILYVDVLGTGRADSLTIVLYDKDGQGIVDTIKASVDFTKNRRHRFACDEIVENLSVRIQDKGFGQNTITGYVIGYIPWDKGKNR